MISRNDPNFDPHNARTALDIDVHVGRRLKAQRLFLGLSQEKLANAVGLTFQQVQKYERGTNRVAAGRLFQFSKILAVPITYFFDGLAGALMLSENKNAASYEPMPTSDSDLADLITTYNSIKNPRKRQEILDFTRKMLAEEN